MAEHNDAQTPPEQLGTVDHHLAYLKLGFIAEQYAALATQAAHKAWSHVDYLARLLEGEAGLDHGVGHPVLIDLPNGSSWWTEGRWRYLNRFQNGGKHRAGLLTEEALRRGCPVRTREEKVVHRCQTCPLSGVVESSQLVIPQREIPVAPFHIGAGALKHLCEF